MRKFQTRVDLPLPRRPEAEGDAGRWYDEVIQAFNDLHRFLSLDLKSLDIKLLQASADYTVLDDDFYTHIDVTTGAAGKTITLPTVADNTDRIITVTKVDSGAGAVTIDGEGAETINGAATQSLASQYDTMTVRSDGSEWFGT